MNLSRVFTIDFEIYLVKITILSKKTKVITMTTTQTDINTKAPKSTRKKQSFRNVDIGTPLKPVRQRQKKQEYETLSDWSHAS